MSIVFVYPRTGLDFAGTIAPPFSSMYASILLSEEGYNVKIIDQRTDKDWKNTLLSELKKEPNFVGISCMTGPQIKFALEVAKAIKKNSKSKIVFGGPHPTILPEQTVKHPLVDMVVKGEGEFTLLELAKALENDKQLESIKGLVFKKDGIVISNQNREPLDINALPSTPWHLIDVEKYIFRAFYKEDAVRMLDIGETSRGCPFQCAYCCSSAVKQHKWRAISAEKVIKSVVSAVTNFKLDGIWVRDDNFYVDLKRVEAICKGIIDSGLKIKWYTAGTRIDTFNRMPVELIKLMKESGCSTLKFGAESGSDRVLNYVQKSLTKKEIIVANLKAKEFGIYPIYTFMVGFPTETKEEIMETLDLMEQLKKDNPDSMVDALNMFTPHAATKLFEIAKQYGLKEPQNLEEWQTFFFRGDCQAVWFDKKTRKFIENMCDMNIYAENVSRVLDSEKNPLLRGFLKTSMFLPKHYYKFRWKHRMFLRDPLLLIMDLARRIWLKH